MNENKIRNIINQDSLIIIGMIMIVIIVGSISSYAYVTWRGRDESGGLTTTIGNLATITFDRGVNLSSDGLTPVLNYQDGIYTTFNINKKIDSDVYIKSFLTINKIDKELKSEALKYILLKSDDNNTFESITTGDFSTIVNGELKLLEDYKLNTNITYYKLYIYLDGRQNNTEMLNKKLDVTLNIGANKKEKEEPNFTIPTSQTTSETITETPNETTDEITSITSETTNTSILEE